MSIVNSIDTIRDWAESAICAKVQLKLPSDEAVESEYPYTLVNPAAFALFVPGKDRLPPQVRAPIPSLCVQLLEGSDALLESRSLLKLRFCFSAWDPGLHALDHFVPKQGEPGVYTQPGTAAYTRGGEGWRDVWNFVDTALRALENAEYIGGMRLVREEPVRFGPMTEQDSIPDYYPNWFAWVSFTVRCGLTRNPEAYGDLL